jgi:VIT1/CCC1 family predicted Fe2+/Mn2+ transporter
VAGTGTPAPGGDPVRPPAPDPLHVGEQHHGDVSAKLNWLRAGVLGANDGIVSVAGIVVGVAGATADRLTILTAGIAGLVAGAFSMAGGEYVSVSTQRDTEAALLRREEWELANLPGPELEELTEIYQGKGLTPVLARQVAEQLTAKDALQAHAEAELGIDPASLTSPWVAAGASFLSFVTGALLPLVAIIAPPHAARVWVCAAAVVAALALTGTVSARLGHAPAGRAVARNVGMGVLAMVVTYGVGLVVGGATT